MSLSEIVDHAYRLRPDDLAGQAHRVVIANVTYQGVEDMTPVLHFAGQPKPLALSPQMTHQLTLVTNTSLRSAWIGHEVIIQPQADAAGPTIAILPPDTTHIRATSRPIARPSSDARSWRMALAIVSALLIASAIYSFVYLPQLQITLRELIGYFQGLQP